MVADPRTGECLGEIVLNGLDEVNGSCNLRILIGPRGRNRGRGSRAPAMLLEHAFGTTALRRIELEVFAFNPVPNRS